MTGEVWGFTGTREQVSSAQMHWLCMMFETHRPSTLRHGACVGADELSHQLALGYGTERIIVHPPIDGRRMMTPDWNHPNVYVCLHKPYHQRNRDIVNRCDRLIALPNSPWKPLGGTWYTVDFARGQKDRWALKRLVPVSLCYPDGETLEIDAAA